MQEVKQRKYLHFVAEKSVYVLLLLAEKQALNFPKPSINQKKIWLRAITGSGSNSSVTSEF